VTTTVGREDVESSLIAVAAVEITAYDKNVAMQPDIEDRDIIAFLIIQFGAGVSVGSLADSPLPAPERLSRLLRDFFP